MTEKDREKIPQCAECGASEWSKDGDGLSSGRYSCEGCGYLPRADTRRNIAEAIEGRE